MSAQTWGELKARLKRRKTKYGVLVEPEELLLYFRHRPDCPYTGEAVRVGVSGKTIMLRVGEDELELAYKRQGFYDVQKEWDRFLYRRIK